MYRRLRDLQKSIVIFSNGAVWTRNASLLKTNIRALMGPYGPQPGPGPNPDWAPTRARASMELPCLRSDSKSRTVMSLSGLKWNHLTSLACTWHQSASLGLTWNNSRSHGLAVILFSEIDLGALGLTWIRLITLGTTRAHMSSL